jgi:hypothetical protein
VLNDLFVTTTYYYLSTLNSQLSTGVWYFAKLKVRDNAGNISNYDGTSTGVLVDTTPPLGSITVFDGTTLNQDIDLTTSSTTLSAVWTVVTDSESGILRYWYAVGTTVGGTDVQGWTDNRISVGATFMAPAGLISGATYYFSVKAENFASLMTQVFTSNGIMVDTYRPDAPSQPVPVVPASWYAADSIYYVSTNTVMFEWSGSTSVSGIKEYHVDVSSNFPFGNDFVRELVTTNTYYTFTGSHGYTYYCAVTERLLVCIFNQQLRC